MDTQEIKSAAIIVWLVISIIILLSLITPFIFSQDAIAAYSPKCIYKAYNKECFMCGMTRSFIYISQGAFSKAERTNRFSLYLYSIFVLNEIGVSLFVINKYKKYPSLIIVN